MVELVRAHALGLLSTSQLLKAHGFLGDSHGVVVERLHTTHDDAQNAHLGSVQRSVQDAIQHILKTAHTFDEAFTSKLVTRMQLQGPVASAFFRDCASVEVHSKHRVSFGNLCEAMLSFVDTLHIADEVFKVMGAEYARTHTLCFTGKLTHLLSALNGLVPGFAVGLDAREELANAMAHVRNRWAAVSGNDMDVYLTHAVPEALQTLEDACVPEAEQSVWMAGI
jgi:uncharacterized damage-inducible protein DinB